MFALPLSYLPERLGAWAIRWRLALTFSGLLIAVLGLSSWFETDRKPLAKATLTIAFTYSLYAITYNTTDSYVYLLTAYLVATYWLAEGLAWLWDRLAERLAQARILRTWGMALLIAVLPAWSVVDNFSSLNLSADREATLWLQDVLLALPPDALLITGQDRHTFALDYAQWVEGRRRDVIVIDGELLPSIWYQQQLAVRYPILAQKTLPSSLPGLVGAFAGDRAIYLSSPRPEIAAHYTVQTSGLLWRVSAPHAPDDAAR
jgi:hypothetical protein